MRSRSEGRWETDTVVLPLPARPYRGPARTAARAARATTALALAVLVAVLVAVVVPVGGVLGHRPPVTSSPATIPGAAARSVPRDDRGGALGEADGVVPDGVTVFDDEVPAVADLDPALLGALRRAATDAADDGVGFSVNSGRRSPAYQDQLRREAVAKYGSEAEAARWVSTAETSLHVSGDAIDIGPPGAAAWLSEHGAAHGLCRVYRNEPWHYELRPEAVDHGCPSLYADPTHDPRMR